MAEEVKELEGQMSIMDIAEEKKEETKTPVKKAPAKKKPAPETIIRQKSRENNLLKKELEEVKEQLEIQTTKNEILFKENKTLKEEIEFISAQTKRAFSSAGVIINEALTTLYNTINNL